MTNDEEQPPSEMEAQVQRLASKAFSKFQALDASQRYLIALSGIPGSGKTTFAASIAHRINDLHRRQWHSSHPHAADYKPFSATDKSPEDPSCPNIAQVIPLDGYHLTRAELSAMPDPDEAHYRRGAAFTFNPDLYLKLVTQLREPLEAGTRTVYAPSFDHAIKDPVENDIPVPPTSRIIIIEGLYVALGREGPWREAASLFDEIWALEVSIETATERVAKRNFAAGLSPSFEEAWKRTEGNDMRNAREVLAEMVGNVSERVQCVEDEEWKGREVKDVEEVLSQRHEKRARMERMGSVAEMADAGVGL